MKRRAVYFLLCACFCFFSLSLSSSAVSQDMLDEGYIYDPGTGSYYIPDLEEPDTSVSYSSESNSVDEDLSFYDPFTGEEMLYDSENGIYYSPYKPLDYEPFQPFLLTSPSYPDFDPIELPWVEMPDFVQDILYGEPQGSVSSMEYSGVYQVPFLLIIVAPEIVHVYAGWNISLSALYRNADQVTNDSPQGIYITSIKALSTVWNNSVCYHAYYDLDYNLVTEWSAVEPTSVGDNGKIVRYGHILQEPEEPRDYYVYGYNGIGPGRSLVSFQVYEDTSVYTRIRAVGDPVAGFANGKYLDMQVNFQSYIGYITPPTPDEISISTSKGIWATLKSIPDMIGDKLKSLFIPSNGFFDTYTQDFQDYFSDRFGLLYELPDKIIDVLQQFIDFSPAEDGYSINFPEVVMPVLDNGEWYDKVIIEETDVKFDFLEQGAFKTLYTMYRSVIWLIFIFALINLIIRKANRVFGGSGG